MVEKARDTVHELIGALVPFARNDVPIIGLEPSCLLTLRDEALAMGLGEEAIAVSKQAFLFEEFVVREIKAERFKLNLNPANAPLLVHGHCHQKAFGAAGAVLDVLKMIPGSHPELIESSCCGMAGNFGYEAEHHAISMEMAEVALLPKIRGAPAAIVVADGISCRHQILDGARREALHAARLLDQLLMPARHAD